MGDIFFDPSEVNIYEYSNGEKIVGIDPLDVHLRMEAYDVDWDAELNTINQVVSSDDPNSKQKQKEIAMAYQSLIKASRELFNLPDLSRANDGAYSGVGGQKALKVLLNYFLFVYDLKKKEDGMPTLLPSSDSVSSVEG